MKTIVVVEKRMRQPDGRTLCHQFHKEIGEKDVSIENGQCEVGTKLIKSWYETDTDHPFTSLEKL